jgi:hypothetical protein
LIINRGVDVPIQAAVKSRAMPIVACFVRAALCHGTKRVAKVVLVGDEYKKRKPRSVLS